MFEIKEKNMQNRKILSVVSMFIVVLMFLSSVSARDWYISVNTGKGKKGTLEAPSKDIAFIINKLEAGDRIFVAVGEYKGKDGTYDINLPVEIYCGWNDTFNKRDAWGEFKTVFTGEHNSDNFATQYRIAIDASKAGTPLMEVRGEPTQHRVVVDGCIIDNGARNFYSPNSNNALLVRKGTSSDTPSPESGGLVISTGITSEIIVNNVIVMNTAPTVGAFAFFPGRAAKVTITNSAAINNTGVGFNLDAGFISDDKSEYPVYHFENNISVFNEKHDPFATYGGSSVMLKGHTTVNISGSIFAMNDYYGVDNARSAKEVTMINNLFYANAFSDYLEFNTKIAIEEIEDWSDYMDDASDNIKEQLNFGVSEQWAATYMAREVIDRNAAEEDVQAVDSWANDVRSIFGLNQQGTNISIDSAVWLPRMSLEDVMTVAGRYMDAYGPFYPAAEDVSP